MHSTLEVMLLLFLCVHSSGCCSRESNDRPSIEFSKIPPAAQGGRERVDTIAGRVIGRRPGQQIVSRVITHRRPWMKRQAKVVPLCL